MVNNSKVTRNLVNVRQRKGLDQHQLANLSGIPLPKLDRIERGAIVPSKEELQALADILNVSTDELGAENRPARKSRRRPRRKRRRRREYREIEPIQRVAFRGDPKKRHLRRRRNRKGAGT